jgi:hypothetical protein
MLLKQFNALMNKVKDRKSMPTFVSRYRVLLVYLFGSFTSLLSSNPSLGKLIIPSTLFAEEQRGEKNIFNSKVLEGLFSLILLAMRGFSLLKPDTDRPSSFLY